MGDNSWNLTSFPKDFQSNTFLRLSNLINRGECIQFFGLPGAGASTLLRMLIQIPAFKSKYFSESGEVKLLLFDSGLLLEKKSLTASRLLLSLFGPQVVVPDDNVMVNKKIIEQIESCSISDKIVIVFDHIQEINTPELKEFFSNLAYLYREFRHKLSFVFVTNKKMTKCLEVENFGSLGRLMVENIVEIDPLDKKDGLWFIDNISSKLGTKLSKEEELRVYSVSAGFPRTIKKLLEAVVRGHKIKDLIENPSIDAALALHLEELAGSKSFDFKGVLFENLNEKKPSFSGDTIGGIELTERLTKLEKDLLTLLVNMNGEMLEREVGIDKLWGKNAAGISDHAYDQIIHRLRERLKLSTPKVKIETVRGRGHCLINN